ncbi:MAG: ATP-binding cassette domain-containing protein [Puniceicoccales bacterium]|jgi:ABC-type glutathione transport system ATPase component|nr:ATP-binding cassette domain-containing protein [Puniceicoccales bacterium]
MVEAENILKLDSLVVDYIHRRRAPWWKRRTLVAVNGVSLSLAKGEALGIVGESGGGKSTLLKAICKFVPIRSGHIFIDGVDVTHFSQKEFSPFRKKIQMIPQDFCSTLDPRMSVEKILAEPLDIHFPHLTAREKFLRIGELLDSVEMDDSLLHRLPRELSGGQRQRLSIARGLAVNPELLMCDEIISACDLFSQKQILSLLTSLNRKKQIALLFVSHNIAAVSHICRDIIVMRDGKLLEWGTASEICTASKHPYTKLLVNAIPHICNGDGLAP